ncbi:MAG: cupin, partial [Actinobacteria bacterium]|nr:cupin [Actinomycetota bacterium]
MTDEPARIGSSPIHLGLGATAEIEPDFTGEPSWYESYSDRHVGDG